MPEEIPELTVTTELSYKAKDGSIKEFCVKQPKNPEQQHLSVQDLRLLAREVSNVLREDAF